MTAIETRKKIDLLKIFILKHGGGEIITWEKMRKYGIW